MDSKLTLKLNKDVIDKAKAYASSHKRSLSRIIEAYLQSLITHKDTGEKGEIQISPFVKSMSSGVRIPSNLDYKNDYAHHLIEKHK